MTTRLRLQPVTRAVLLALLLIPMLYTPTFGQRSRCEPAPRSPADRRCVKEKRRPAPPPERKHHERGWEVIWAPYLWASGLDGQVGVGGNVVEIDMSFSEIFDHLDYGIFIPVEMRKGRWSAVIELMAAKISGQSALPRTLFETAELESNQMTIEVSPRYRMTRPGPVDVDLIGGFRLWQISSNLVLSDGVDLTTGLGEMWFDPIFGTRAIAEFRNGFVLQTRGDIGGFGVGSEFTWQLLGVVGYRISSSTTLAGGDRYLKVDFEDDDDDFLFDVAMKGFIVGAAIRL